MYVDLLGLQFGQNGQQIQISVSSFINIHWFVFISRPDHMQITPDTEGYLSISYSKSTYSTNMAAGYLGQGHS